MSINKSMKQRHFVLTEFIRYVSQSVMGLLGVSCYILADTFFISKAAGANGITVLNLSLPVYGIIFAIGSMIGVGSATRYAILSARKEEEANHYFSNAFFWDLLLSLPFVIAGIFAPGKVLALMGGDAEIVALGIPYARLFLIFAPAFMVNHLFQAFVRNDGDPTRSMIATLSSSIFNIIFDYIFMFPLHMGLSGAALATGISPLVGVLISGTHFLGKNNHVCFVGKSFSFRRLIGSCQLGISAFVTEISSAVITTVFNFLILSRVGNIGVAAYGVVANLALVAVAIFNGIATGMQPLISAYYGQNDRRSIAKLLKMGLLTAFLIALVLNGVIWSCTDEISGIFNSEQSELLTEYAHVGMRYYFLGYLFAGINIVSGGYFGAMEQAKQAFVVSMMRGFVVIVIVAVVMAFLFGMTGIWLSFMVAEAITAVVTGVFLLKGTGSRSRS